MAHKKTGTVTLKDIAAATGFSANTVSRALSDKPDISEETKEIIRKKAEEMGYIANALASFLRSGVSRNISIIVGDISNPHFSVMVKEMQMLLQKKGYNSIIFNTEEKPEMERQAVTVSISQNVDGIIICPTPGGEANIGLLRHYGKPFVLIGRRIKENPGDKKASYVICDDENSGYIATRCLLNKGHRRVLFLNGPKEISSAAERLAGYRRALKEAGVPYDGRLVHTVPVTAGRGADAGPPPGPAGEDPAAGADPGAGPASGTRSRPYTRIPSCSAQRSLSATLAAVRSSPASRPATTSVTGPGPGRRAPATRTRPGPCW